MPAPLLLLQDINLTFGVAPLLSGAELAVAAGDRICMVGRNGSAIPERAMLSCSTASSSRMSAASTFRSLVSEYEK
jgi:hypothetical protein